MRVVGAVVNVVLVILYPVAIWWSLAHYSARMVGVIALAILVPTVASRFRRTDRANLLTVLRIPLLVMALLLAGVAFDHPLFVLALPVLVSFGLLVTFGATLLGDGPTMVERFARLQEPELNDAKVAHCRQATVAWVVFFAFNGAVAALLALLDQRFLWALYTSAIAYALMGLLLSVEYVLRRYRFRDYGRGPHDRALARLWPPRDEVSP